MAGVVCPQCRKSNPAEREDCQYCGARLRLATEPLPPIRPGEQPVKKNTSELERALPSWLREARAASDSREPQQATSLDGKDAPPPRKKDELPDWLAGLEAESKAEDEQLPEWLRSLQGEPPSPAPAPQAPSEEVPDWLRQLRESAPASEPPAPPAPPPPAPDSSADLPAWLRGETPPSAPPREVPAGEPVRTRPAAHESLPDWLAEKVSAADAESSRIPLPGAEPSGGQADLPDWLSRLSGSAESTPVQPGKLGTSPLSESAPPTDENLPDWMSRAVEPPPAAPSPEPLSPEPVEMPDWLRSLTAESPGGPPPMSSTPALIMDEPASGGQEDVEAIFSMDMPEWLSGESREKPSAPATGPFTTPPPADLAPGELPSWVQAMRPVEAVLGEGAPPVDESEPQERAGPLAGLRGVLPAVPQLLAGRRPQPYPNRLQVSDSQQAHAALLDHLIESETRPHPISVGGATRPQRLLRWLVALLLLAVTALPVLGGTQFTPMMALGLFPNQTIEALKVVNELPGSAPVLVVLDYEPSLTGEMQAVASPLLDHLMLRGARLTLISTSPAGPALAERLIAAQSHAYQAGAQYVNLGYLAGGPAGVLAFVLDPPGAARGTVDGAPAWESAPLQGVRTYADFAAVVIVTDNAESARAWLEQGGPYRGGRPTLLAVSAQAEPMLIPYYHSGQAQGMLGGLSGGAAYETLTGRTGPARAYWDAFGLGLVLALLLILAGGLGSLALGWRDRHAEPDL